jgi:hypothetical protein
MLIVRYLTKKYVIMKKFPLLLSLMLIFVLQQSVLGQKRELDSLVIEKKLITVGQPFHIDERCCSMRVYDALNERSFYEDKNGNYHIVFISNYELTYFYSSDKGDSWIGGKVETGHDGDLKRAIVTADKDGNPRIAITVNDLFNYHTKPNGYLYELDSYLISKNSGDSDWKVETLYMTSGNYGFMVEDIYVDDDAGLTYILGSRYGWDTLGGEVWEITKKDDNTISGLNILTKYNDKLDRHLFGCQYLLYDNNEKDIFFVRNHNTEELEEDGKVLQEASTIHFDGKEWGKPKQITTVKSIHHIKNTNDRKGNNYTAYFKNTPNVKVVMYKNFLYPKELDLDLSMISEIYAMNLNYLDGDEIHLSIYTPRPEGGKYYMYQFISKDYGETWAKPIVIDYDYYRLGHFAKTSPQSKNLPGTNYIQITRVPTKGEPYGPDSLFFYKAKFIDSKLGIHNEVVENNFKIYPNPVQRELNIESSKLNSSKLIGLNVFDSKGLVVIKQYYEKNNGGKNIVLDLKKLSKGVYFLELLSLDNGNTLRYTSKFVKK